jgi:hypothetical protein
VSLVEFGLDCTFHVLNIFNFQWSKQNEAKGASHNLIFTRPVERFSPTISGNLLRILLLNVCSCYIQCWLWFASQGPNIGSQPLYHLLAGSYQYSQLSIESEIRQLCRMVLHRSSFDIFKFCSDVASPHVCQFVCPTHSCCQTVVHSITSGISILHVSKYFWVKYSHLIQWKIIITTIHFFKKSFSNQSYCLYSP